MIVTEIDAITNEVIERKMTAEEIQEREESEAIRIAAEIAQTDAKNALLNRLGITAEEAKLLLA
jgi:hypothetical protein